MPLAGCLCTNGCTPGCTNRGSCPCADGSPNAPTNLSTAHWYVFDHDFMPGPALRANARSPTRIPTRIRALSMRRISLTNAATYVPANGCSYALPFGALTAATYRLPLGNTNALRFGARLGVTYCPTHAVAGRRPRPYRRTRLRKAVTAVVADGRANAEPVGGYERVTGPGVGRVAPQVQK